MINIHSDNAVAKTDTDVAQMQDTGLVEDRAHLFREDPHQAERDWRDAVFGKASGSSLRAIAREMSRSHSMISRELRRNSGGRGDRHQQAEQTAQERRRQASSRLWKMTEALLRMACPIRCFC